MISAMLKMLILVATIRAIEAVLENNGEDWM